MAQYLSDEQKKMLDLWTELQRVRKQFADLKTQTEEDLEKQRNDFARVFRSLQGITRSGSGDVSFWFILFNDHFFQAGLFGGGGSTTYNVDTLIQETIRRFGGGRGGPYATDLELLALLKNKSAATDDNELHAE